MYLLKKKGEVGCCGRAVPAHNTPHPYLLKRYPSILLQNAADFMTNGRHFSPANASVSLPQKPFQLQESKSRFLPSPFGYERGLRKRDFHTRRPEDSEKSS